MCSLAFNTQAHHPQSILFSICFKLFLKGIYSTPTSSHYILKDKEMSSFELVNHQIKHMFGGIEAEKNSSLDHLQIWQKKIAKSMQKAQVNHKKIYQSLGTIKNCLVELTENYLTLSKETKHSGGLITKLSSEINTFLQDVSQQSLSQSKKMESKGESYLPNLKKIKQKYSECAENLEHYRKKVSLLKKGVDKQLLANIKQDEHERYERNKEKLRNAEKEYDQILLKVTKRFIEFNNQGMKDIYNDLITIFSNIGGNVMTVSNKLTKYLCQNFGSRQILLAKQLKIHKKVPLKPQIESKDKKQSTIQWMRDQNSEHRQFFFEHLIEEKQISNYLKSIIDRQLVKMNSGVEKIQDVFEKKPLVHEHKEEFSSSFSQFKNIFNSHQIRQSHHTKLEAMKEEDPIEACQDLLEIEEPTQITTGFQNEQISKYDLDCSPEFEKKCPANTESPEIKMKKNLEKFDKICQENHLGKMKISQLKSTEKLTKQPLPDVKNVLVVQDKTKDLKKAAKTSQFFNVNFFEQKKEPAPVILKPQQKLTKMHEHPFNFDIFEATPVKTQASKPPSIASKIKSGNELFTNFDQLIEPTLSEKKNSNPPVSPTSNHNLFQFQTANITTSKPPKPKSNNFDDLLNL